MGRYIGLDVGNKTIGVALSDELFMTAQGNRTIIRTGIKSDLLELEHIISENDIIKIIVGLPKNMNNTLGPQGEKVLKFVGKLKKKFYEKEIILVDERLSTVSAEKLLISGDTRRDKRKKVIDKVAATIILQTYLDSKENHNEKE